MNIKTEDNMEEYVTLQVKPLSRKYDGIIDKQGETITVFPSSYCLKLGADQNAINKVVYDFIDDDQSWRDGCFAFKISRVTAIDNLKADTKQIQRIVNEVERCNRELNRTRSSLKFVNLHAHSGVGSPFDGFGYPQEHMDFAYQNGCEALALTDHGNMNGFAYQVLHAKKMKAAGKQFKPIFGVEAYFIPSVPEWKEQLEEFKKDKKKAKQIDAGRSGTNIEADGESKGKSKSDINRTRHLVLIAMNQTGLNNIFKMVSESYNGDYFYRKPRVDYDLLEKYNEGVIASSA